MAAAGLIDFRTHYRSRAFFQGLAEESPLPGQPEEKLARVAEAEGLTLPADAAEHLAHWLAELEDASITRAVTMSSYRAEHQLLARAAADSAGRLAPFAVFDPTAPGAPDEARELLGEMGFRGLGLAPALHDYRLDGPELTELLLAIEEFTPNLIIWCGSLYRPIHDLFLVPRRYRLQLGNPLHLVPTADRFPRARFILASLGGGFLREALMLGSQCRNVYAETAGVESWLFTQPGRLGMGDLFEQVLGVFGHERVLFGSGSEGHEEHWRRRELTLQREALGACGLDSEQRAAVFSGNAARVLGV